MFSKSENAAETALRKSATSRFGEDAYVSVGATAKFYLMAARSLGYSNYEAMADIVDNPLDDDVAAKNIWIEIDNNLKSISIIDDGNGMTHAILKDAFKLGAAGGEILAEDLGLFGCGLKLASLSMAREFKVITKHKDDEYLVGIYDVDDFANQEKPMAPMGSANYEEIKEFKRATKGAETGTVITLSKIDNLKTNNFTTFKNRLSKDFSEIYRYIIDDGQVTIRVNGVALKPADTMCIESGDGKLFNSSVPNQIYPFKFKHNGVEHNIHVKIRVYYIKNVSKLRSDEIGRTWKNQGFYIFRNNRQIMRAKTLGLYTKHPDLNGFRAEIFLTGEHDQFSGINLQKKEIDLPQGFLDKLDSYMSDVLKSVREQNRAESKGKDIKADGDLKESLDKTKTHINSMGGKIRPEGVMTDKEKRDRVTKDHTGGGDTPTPTDDKKKRSYPDNTTKRSRKIFDYGLESQGIKGDICRFINQGNGVISLMLNTDHDFYSEVFVPSNDDVRSNLVKLLFSLGRSQEEMIKEEVDEDKKDDLREMFENRLERMSRIFTKLN